MKKTVTDWTKYWRSNSSLNSFFGGVYEGQYSGELLQFWRQQFATHEVAGPILDLCTGNGAIAAIAAEALSKGVDASDIFAVDAADISPLENPSLPTKQMHLLKRIRFAGGVNVESLPFPDEMFSMVSSQFGIEYADLGRSLKESVRVLKPGGRGVFVLHSIDSVIYRDAVAERTALCALMTSSIWLLVANIGQRVDQLKAEGALQSLSGDPLAIQLRASYNSTLQELKASMNQRDYLQYIEPYHRLLLNQLQRLIQDRQETQTAYHTNISELKDAVKENISRLSDLCESAVSDQKLAGIRAVLGSDVQQFHDELFYDRGQCVGCKLIIIK